MTRKYINGKIIYYIYIIIRVKINIADDNNLYNNLNWLINFKKPNIMKVLFTTDTQKHKRAY